MPLNAAVGTTGIPPPGPAISAGMLRQFTTTPVPGAATRDNRNDPAPFAATVTGVPVALTGAIHRSLVSATLQIFRPRRDGLYATRGVTEVGTETPVTNGKLAPT